MIKIIVTINDSKAKTQCNRMKEEYIIEQDKEAMLFLEKEFKHFLEHKLKPMSYENVNCGLKIQWK